MKRRIIIAFSTIFLFGSVISTVIYDDSVTSKTKTIHKTKTMRTFSTVDPDPY